MAILSRYAAGDISIHALREEGDTSRLPKTYTEYIFLSTPSARRATCKLTSRSSWANNFYPRPPRGGRPKTLRAKQSTQTISIHALREEGDDSREISRS